MKSEAEAQQTIDDLAALDHPGIDWQEIFHAVRERLWILILFLVLAAIAATIYMSSQKQEYPGALRPVHRAGARPHVARPRSRTCATETIVTLDMINTVVDLLRSFPFAERVADRLKLQQDPRFLAVT